MDYNADFTYKPSLRNRILDGLAKYTRILFGRKLSDKIMSKFFPGWFIENELYEILSEEITKEINAELIRTITMTAKEEGNE